MSADARPRQLRFDGARNVRDLGGLPAGDGTTRFGAVFRSDGLGRLSEADIERLAGLGLSTVIDLRYREERERLPDRLPPGDTPALVHLGFQPRGSVEVFHALNDNGADGATAFRMMRDNYRRIPFEHADELGALLRAMAAPAAAPLLVHCTSGKDRTGILVALLLRAVGVEHDAVVADFELSNTEHQPIDVFGPNARPDAVAEVMAAHADYILATFDSIEREGGGFDRYLRTSLGIDVATRNRLCALLL